MQTDRSQDQVPNMWDLACLHLHKNTDKPVSGIEWVKEIQQKHSLARYLKVVQ